MKKDEGIDVFHVWRTATKILLESGISVGVLQKGIRDIKEDMK